MPRSEVHRIGEKFYQVDYDDTGEQVGAKELPPQEVLKGGSQVTLRPSNWQDTFRQYSPLVRGTAVTTGRALGGIAAAPAAAASTPVGAAATEAAGIMGGGMLGDYAYQALQGLSPRTFGPPPESVAEGANQAAINTLVDYGASKFVANPLSKFIGDNLGALLTKGGRENLKGTLLQKFFPINPNIPVQEGLEKAPTGFGFDVAQATQNTRALALRDALAKDKALGEFKDQQGDLTSQANSILTNYLGKPATVDLSASGRALSAQYSKEFNAALKDVGKAKLLIAANGTPMREELGTEYMRRILEGARDANLQFTGAKGALDKFYGSKDMAMTVLPRAVRDQFEYLLRRMQAVDPKMTQAGHTTLTFYGVNALLGLSTGMIRGLTDEDPSPLSGMKLGTGVFLGSMLMSKQVIKNLFFNPANARMAAKLVSLPPRSAEAQFIVRSLFKGPLKGAQFMTQYGPMIVGPDGKLDPVQNPQ